MDGGGGAKLLSLAGSRNSRKVAFAPDGKTLASATGETVKLWDVASGRELKTIIGNKSMVFSVAYSPTGKWLAAGSMGQVRVWEIASGEPIYDLEHRNWVNDLAFSPDGETLAADRGDSAIVLWDMASGEQRAVLEAHAGDVTGLAFSPDGRLLASSSRDLTIRLWEISTGKELNALVGHSGWAQAVAFSPDGATLASGALDQTRLWGVGE